MAALTEKKRQRRIKQIKQKEKKLRRQGKYDDVAKLFQNLFVIEQAKKVVFWKKNHLYRSFIANFKFFKLFELDR